MSKNKLAKFADIDKLENVLQYPFSILKNEGAFPFRGLWNSDVFENCNPIVIELGCGRGEYTLGLAQKYPNKNFIGIDIKGNRIWSGAMKADQEGMKNVRFLRTEIEFLTHFFAPNEVSEIWLTFPDPQMKKVRKRLTSTRFLKIYHQILGGKKILNLKSDSQFLYLYTKAVAQSNGLDVLSDWDNIYSQVEENSDLRQIQTYYERQWLARGIDIKYLCISLLNINDELVEPDVDIPMDEYRSYGRNRRSELNI